MTARTLSGGGKSRVSATIEAACHNAISTRSDRSLSSTSLAHCIFVERPRVEVRSRANELGAPDPGEHQIKLARIRLFIRDPNGG